MALHSKKEIALRHFGLLGYYEKCHLVEINDKTIYPIAMKDGFSFPLYKFIDPLHADNFFKYGTLRLGTFWDFSREDIHGISIGDMKEGILHHEFHIKNDKNTKIICNIMAVNCYIYCVSAIYDERLRQEFGKCVIEICDVGFFSEISKAIHGRVGACVLGPVDYHDDVSWTKTLNNCIDEQGFDSDKVPRISHTKDSNYEYQNEIRCAWETLTRYDERNNNLIGNDEDKLDRINQYRADKQKYIEKYDVGVRISPLIIDVPEARKYARRLC